MSLYKEVSTNLSFVEREQETEKFWEENRIFEKSVEERKDDPTYTFYDGPPTANGKPHIGHLQTRSFKDLFPRFHTMKGEMVPRKAGWDTHGLPVELEVEKLLHINGKDQIEAYGIAPFIEKCKESVWKYKGMWEDFSKDVGFWADMEHPYVTYDNSFIESEWWALKQIWDKGLLYKGFKIVPYCPRCGTPLSSHEVAQGYKDVKERSAIAKFKVKGEEAFILAWTTTPWTLPSNVALCVNANEDYVKVESKGETYYLAAALCDTVLGEGEYTVLETCKGADLEGKEYEPLFDFVSPKEKCWYVVCDDYVTLTDGTGIVHIAPAFGEGRRQGGPQVRPAPGAAGGRQGPDDRRDQVARGVLQGRGPQNFAGPGGAGPLVLRPEIRAQLPLLLALRYPPHLLRPGVLVHQDDRGKGPAHPEQQHGKVVPREHRQGPLRRLAGERPGLGGQPEPLLGHAPEHLGV